MSSKDFQPEQEPAAWPDPVATTHRILIADDEPVIRHLISSALLNSGYVVDAAGDGAEAWEAIQANDYNLLIVDNNMPKISGVELLEKLHATARSLPSIMITGVNPEAEFKRRPWLQPDATLIKPFAIAELRETVKKILSESPAPSKAANIYVA